ncbi:MAG: TRAP transporter substrate-binding protein DctP [Desulfobacterales bacterium]
MIKKLFVGGLLAVAVFFGGSPAGAQEAPDIMIKLATIAPRGSYIMNRMNEINAEIKAKTDNAVGIKIYYGGVQGDEKDVLRKIRLGQLHGGMFTGHGLGQIVPQVRVTEVPFVFKNYSEVEYVREQLAPTMRELFKEAGYIVLGWNEVGFVYNFSKVPITSIEVARGQKWWMWKGDQLSRAMFEAIGITPVPLSFTDVMTSLSTKLIDTASITPYGAVAYRWHERFDYMSEYPTTNVLGATIVTRRIWNKIAPAHQQAILETCTPYFEKINAHVRQQDSKSIEILKKSGIEVVPFDPEKNREQFEFIFEASRKARERLVGEMYSRELLEKTLAILEEYRNAHPNSAVEKVH